MFPDIHVWPTKFASLKYIIVFLAPATGTAVKLQDQWIFRKFVFGGGNFYFVSI